MAKVYEILMREKHEGIGSNGPGKMSDPVHPKGEGLSFPP